MSDRHDGIPRLHDDEEAPDDGPTKVGAPPPQLVAASRNGAVLESDAKKKAATDRSGIRPTKDGPPDVDTLRVPASMRDRVVEEVETRAAQKTGSTSDAETQPVPADVRSDVVAIVDARAPAATWKSSYVPIPAPAKSDARLAVEIGAGAVVLAAVLAPILYWLFG